MFALSSVGPPLISYTKRNKKILTAKTVFDHPEFTTLWGEASLDKPEASACTFEVSGVLIKSVPLHTGPLCFTINNTGFYIIAWTPMKHTIRDRYGQVWTVTVGLPAGVSPDAVPCLINTRPHTISVDSVLADLAPQLDVACSGCLQHLPLRMGNQCARCIMTNAPTIISD